MAPAAAPAPPRAHIRSEAKAERGRHTSRLLLRYHRDGDLGAREELVERFLPLARQLARRYARGREPLEDLVQVASVGLVKAIDRFDVERKTSFSSYAVPTMLGELRRHFRDTGWALHVPRGMQERALEVEHAVEALSARHGRAPSPAEIGDYVGATPEEVLSAMGAHRAAEAVSLDAERGSEDGERATRGELIGAEDGGYELVEYGSAIAGTLQALPERDRLVLELRFAGDLTQTEIAARIGVSQMQVSRLMRRALERLRTVADAS